MPKMEIPSKKQVCPRCKKEATKRGQDYYCRNCNLIFNREIKEAKKIDEDLTEESFEEKILSEIKKLKTKAKVTGSLLILTGLIFLSLSTISSGFIFLATFYILFGAYLFI